MRKKYIYISLLISTGIYAIADYYCIYNFTFTLLFTIFLIFNLVNSVICFAKNSCEFSIIASIIYVFMIMHNLFVLAFNYSISSGGFHTIWGERLEQKKNVQYDAYAKYILSQKEVLARILKFTIAEFQDLEGEVIMELIEGEPLVSKVSTEPGETNQTLHDKITGNNTENTELGEGTIFFDVIFYVRMKDGVSRIINFALNKNWCRKIEF